ncbi:MFS transporter [Niallia sp. Krafla_26]|uniref:MFS transporter n=1 Tax=Niallia sp. Krafla_26 TaxID=3064703 RepID=UPI003D179CBB
MRPVTGRIFDQYNEHYIIYCGAFLFTVGLICLCLANTAVVFLLSAAIIGAGFSRLSPSLQAFAVKSMTTRRSGLATATYLTFFDIGVGLGSFVLGIIVSGTSFSMMYFFSAILVIFSAIIYYYLHHRQKVSIKTKEHMNA